MTESVQVGLPGRRRLLAADPLLGQPLVIAPTPSSTVTDLLCDVGESLCLLATRRLSRDRVAEALEAWAIPRILLLDADHLTAGTLHALHADFESMGVEVVEVQTVRGGRPPRQLRLADPSDRIDERALAALITQLSVGSPSTTGPLDRLDLTFLTSRLFDRSRSGTGALGRLRALQGAVPDRGVVIHADPDVRSLAARPPEAHLWLDRLATIAYEPPPRPAGRARHLHDRKTVETYLDGHPAAGRAFTARSLDELGRWREDEGVPETDLTGPDLDRWAQEQVARGHTLVTVRQRLSAAARFERYRLTGHLDVPDTVRTRHGRPPVQAEEWFEAPRAPDPYAQMVVQRLEAARTGARRVRNDSNAVMLARLTGLPAEDIQGMVDAARISDSEWQQVRVVAAEDLDRVAPAAHQRARLEAVVFAAIAQVGLNRVPHVICEHRAGVLTRFRAELTASPTWPSLRVLLSQGRQLRFGARVPRLRGSR